MITGCAGFIGSHLAERLLHLGYQVIGIDNFDQFYSKTIKERNIKKSLLNSDFSFIEGDICSTSDLYQLPNDVDVVVHLAAKAGVRPSIEDPEAYINTNIGGTKSILDWMKEKQMTKIVFASSSSIYGNNKKVPFSESDHVDNPISPYAFTKKSCELLNHTYHHLYNIDVINLRLFTVYGPRQRPDLAIKKFTDLISNNEAVPMYGDGSTSRDYTYVDDIVQGFEKAIKYISNSENIYETVNIGNHSPTKLIDLIETLYELQEKRPNVKYLPMQEGDVNHTCADISLAQKILNYKPNTGLNKGLEEYIKWHKEQFKTIV